MPYSRPTLPQLMGRVYQDHAVQLAPMANLPRENLVKVLSRVDAGMYHQLFGEIDYLSRQIFPDSADGAILRAHWSDRVPPLLAVAATGLVKFSGTIGASIPLGLILASDSGASYFLQTQVSVDATGFAVGSIKALDAGLAGNAAAGTTLRIASTVPPGVDKVAIVEPTAIIGGVDEENDIAYLVRVLMHIRSGSRYGKKGDFAAWALDASPEVGRAWEIRNSGVFGALLIQVASGNQVNGIAPVTNIDLVADYIASVAPPIVFTVRTPEIVSTDPQIHLLPAEDSVANRAIAEARLKNWYEVVIEPGSSLAASQLRAVIVDGVVFTDATVTIPGGDKTTSILQLLTLGTLAWI